MLALALAIVSSADHHLMTGVLPGRERSDVSGWSPESLSPGGYPMGAAGAARPPKTSDRPAGSPEIH